MSTPAAQAPKKNRTVTDQHGKSYELTGKIGEGGQGVVYTTNYPNVLVKIARLNPNMAENRISWADNIRALMRQPLENLAIAHPLALITQPQPGYVMELMDGLGPMTEQIQQATDALMSEGRCIIPSSNGVLSYTRSQYRYLDRSELWDNYYTLAPARQRRCVETYKIVKRA